MYLTGLCLLPAAAIGSRVRRPCAAMSCIPTEVAVVCWRSCVVRTLCRSRYTAGTTVVSDRRSSGFVLPVTSHLPVALFRCGGGEFGGTGAEIVQQILARFGREEDRKAAEQQDAKEQDATEYP